VPDVGVDHQQVVVADRRDAAALFRAEVERDGLAEHVAVADGELRAGALVLLVLRGQPDDGVGKKTLSRPIVVSPRIVTLLSRRQPGPMRTSGPITQNGPISTSSAMSALRSTTACGEILGVSSEKKRNVNRELNHAGRLRGVGRGAGGAGAAAGVASGGLMSSCSIGSFRELEHQGH
jgi:hypothetical protein